MVWVGTWCLAAKPPNLAINIALKEVGSEEDGDQTSENGHCCESISSKQFLSTIGFVYFAGHLAAYSIETWFSSSSTVRHVDSTFRSVARGYDGGETLDADQGSSPVSPGEIEDSETRHLRVGRLLEACKMR